MSIRLVGSDGNRYYSFEIITGCHTIGRQEGCDIVIPNKTVSRKHAEIDLQENGTCYLSDFGSHNGTSVNGSKISERVEVQPGSEIAFGQLDFRLTDEDISAIKASRPTVTRLAQSEVEKSVFLSINEALQPLPSKVADLPNLFPTLSEMARMLVLPEPKEVMLNRALELVSKVVPAERLAILFTTENKDEVYTAATLLPSGKDPGEFHLSRTIISDILSEKQAVLVGDATQDPRLAEQKSIVAMHLKSAMAVPLFDEGDVLGILYVDSSNPIHRYSDDYLRLLATFGNVIASRLANYALLHEREEKRLIEVELERASGIQQHLLRQNSPTIENYDIHAVQEQCRAVGGDLYDLATLSDGRLLFLVADVSGKGLGAALLMSNILASFRIMYTQSEFNLLKVVEAVSKQLYLSSQPGDFATLFAGTIDLKQHTIAYVNAGHNPGYVVRSDGGIETMEASGTMIGAFEEMSWEENKITFQSGDLLCLYSDGVTEAERENGEQYGEERFQSILTSSRSNKAAELTGILREDIAKFVKNAPQSDDVTILLIKRDS